MKFSPLPVVAMAFFGSACGASIESARFVKAAPTPADQPIRFFSTQLPGCEYEELGIVRGIPKDGFTKLQDVLDGLAEEARRMGGEAIIGVKQTKVAGGIAVEQAGNVESRTELTGTVIRCR